MQLFESYKPRVLAFCISRDLCKSRDRFTTWGVTWPWRRGQPWIWPLANKKYIIRRALTRGLRWCVNFGFAATYSGVMSKIPNPDLLVIDFTSDLWGHWLTWHLIWVPIPASRNGRHGKFFLRSSGSIRGETVKGGRMYQLLSAGAYVETCYVWRGSTLLSFCYNCF